MIRRLESGRAMKITKFEEGSRLLTGDCFDLLNSVADESVDITITSPPYCMGKAYENSRDIQDFIEIHRKLLPAIVRKTKVGGSICWQVGNHVSDRGVIPLDFHIHQIMQALDGLFLRNRIVWTFGHGVHATRRLSGRYETLLWYTKGEKYFFDLDAIRIPQRYPGKKYYKGPNKGKFSANPLGKNPSDVWDIPNVKAKHPEKTAHPCQFPIELAKRLILGMSPIGGLVLDPFTGSGTTGAAAVLSERKFIGSEIDPTYAKIAARRIRSAIQGTLQYRPAFKPVMSPPPTHSVSRRPELWNEATR
jgi:adenine-specific DNA-methyltransferase